MRATRSHGAQLVHHWPNGGERCIRIQGPVAGEGNTLSAAVIIPILAGHTQEHIEQILAIRRTHSR